MSEAIEYGLFLEVGGLKQWVTIRGRDRANPALMILTGAGAAFSAMAPMFAPWEARFTLVQWDQPGSGATLAANLGDAQPLTYDRLVRDGVEVAEAVCARLGVDRLALFAISGGSVTGLKMLRAGPGRFSAYVGNGQVTNWRRQEALAYRIMLAQQAGDAAATAELTAIGPPPWVDARAELAKAKFANAPTPAEQAALGKVQPPPPDANWIAPVPPVANPYAAAYAAYQALRPELLAFDAEALGLEFDLPMVFLQGAHDAHTPAAEVEAYAAKLTAPVVRYIPIAEGGHMSTFLVDRLAALLDEHVRPLLV